ncbi:MAG: hypothetical protein RLZZ612_343 [Pseudomonadota bacterium]
MRSTHLPSTQPLEFKLALVFPDRLFWRLRKNCSATPKQVLGMYAALSFISLCIAGGFWLAGAVFVLPFACLEVIALGVACGWYARHALDGETISCDGLNVVIDTSYAGVSKRYVFAKHTVRVCQKRDASLIEVFSQGQKLEVGRFLRTDLQPLLISELKYALARV